MTQPILTQKYLKEALDYNSETGDLFWKIRPREHFRTVRGWRIFNTKYSGKKTGAINTLNRYSYITIDNFPRVAHRLVFMIMTGEYPEQVDHINHDRSDNRWINLRESNDKDNKKNQIMRSDNKSGFTGVFYDWNRGKWLASIRSDNKCKHLGRFESKAEAIIARKAANIKYGFHENHGLCQT